MVNGARMSSHSLVKWLQCFDTAYASRVIDSVSTMSVMLKHMSQIVSKNSSPQLAVRNCIRTPFLEFQPWPKLWHSLAEGSCTDVSSGKGCLCFPYHRIRQIPMLRSAPSCLRSLMWNERSIVSCVSPTMGLTMEQRNKFFGV